VKERAMETFVAEIAGEPVMAFRAENEEEAQELGRELINRPCLRSTSAPGRKAAIVTAPTEVA
jgi:hypothetical protein